EHYARSRRVYALDLPGFGFSDRSPRDYTPRMYTDAVLDMVAEIAHDGQDAPVDALALSLSSEFLARAAAEQPDLFGSIALITPTGFGKREQFYGPIGSTRGSTLVRQLFDVPLWSRPYFDLLSSKPSIRYFLKKTFGSYEAIDAGLAQYDHISAHQPDAQHAPYAFISGLLFSADIDRIYEALDIPTWLAYGPKIEFSRFDDLGNVAGRPNWSITQFATGGLPQFEALAAFTAAYDTFLVQAAISRLA
ncbi:MAG: alpha/beta fold hydrolase, partial [Roseiflexaceae bacterium]|nr:alpha/beta fold hydrolase [Roseiflexaceae bacterium]